MLLFQKNNNQSQTSKALKSAADYDEFYLTEELEGLEVLLQILGRVDEWVDDIPEIATLGMCFRASYITVKDFLEASRKVRQVRGKRGARRNIVSGKLLLSHYIELLSQTFKRFPEIALILKNSLASLTSTNQKNYLNAQTLLIKISLN